MKLIVSDLDGTLLNSNKEISEENAEALRAAQQQGIEIAIATGRNYKNTRALCQGIGLSAHIISNHGAFVYTKDGQKLMSTGMDKQHVKHAIKWLHDNNYFYNLCTDQEVFRPDNGNNLLSNDFEKTEHKVAGFTDDEVRTKIKRLLAMQGVQSFHYIEDVLTQDLVFGSITAITYDKQKLTTGRAYFNNYEGLAMTVAGEDIFEMIHPGVSKGNALEYLVRDLNIPLQEVMAIGDNYNDISMLEKVGYSVAMGNADPAIKQICRYVSLTNNHSGVAHIVNKFLSKFSVADDGVEPAILVDGRFAITQ